MQIRISGNFRGKKVAPAEPLSGNPRNIIKYLVISEEPAHCRVSARRRRENFASKQPDYVEIRDFSGAT